MVGPHHEEEEDFFVGVGRAPSADAQAVTDERVEGGGFDDGVDLPGAEADA